MLDVVASVKDTYTACVHPIACIGLLDRLYDVKLHVYSVTDRGCDPYKCELCITEFITIIKLEYIDLLCMCS